MQTYLIERHWGPTEPERLSAAAERSKRQLEGKFSDSITWIRSHAIETDEGLVTYCLYEATDAAVIRAHAQAAKVPCDAVSPTQVIGPQA